MPSIDWQAQDLFFHPTNPTWQYSEVEAIGPLEIGCRYPFWLAVWLTGFSEKRMCAGLRAWSRKV